MIKQKILKKYQIKNKEMIKKTKYKLNRERKKTMYMGNSC